MAKSNMTMDQIATLKKMGFTTYGWGHEYIGYKREPNRESGMIWVAGNGQVKWKVWEDDKKKVHRGAAANVAAAGRTVKALVDKLYKERKQKGESRIMKRGVPRGTTAKRAKEALLARSVEVEMDDRDVGELVEMGYALTELIELIDRVVTPASYFGRMEDAINATRVQSPEAKRIVQQAKQAMQGLSKIDTNSLKQIANKLRQVEKQLDRFY